MALSLVQMEGGYYPFFDKGQPIAGGQLYVGLSGFDPEPIGNQIAVQAVQQDGSTVSIAQPITLSAGGVPSLNGANVVLIADGDFSMKVLDKIGGLAYYHPRRALGAPIDSSESVRVFSTVALAKEQTYTLGQLVQTIENTTGNGGGASYVVSALNSPDGFGDHATDDGDFQLTLEITKDTTSAQFGALADWNGASGTDDSTAIQAMVNAMSVPALREGFSYISVPIMADSFKIFVGAGIDISGLIATTDIEMVSSASLITDRITRFTLADMTLEKVDLLRPSTTKYEVHLTNPTVCDVRRCRVKSWHNDTDYSATNVGGIFFDKPAGSIEAAFINTVEDCWVQNNSVYFKNITDSVIRGGYVWGHTREFGIHLEGGGANSVEGIVGLICSKFEGGIYVTGAGNNQIRITDIEFDGNPLLDTGIGVNVPQQAVGMTITGSTMWGCDKEAIRAVDPVGLTITGNNFWKNNAADNGHNDVEIVGENITPNTVTISGNTFVIDDARSNPGYAIGEVNAGFNPTENIYANNAISGSYKTDGRYYPQINTLQLGAQKALIEGNTGQGGVGYNTSVIGSAVATVGEVDINVGPDGQDWAGILTVSNTRTDFPTQSRQRVYAVMGRGATGTLTQIGTADGTGGGATFTVAVSSVGVITLTNTFANATTVKMSFNGLQGA